MKKAPSKPLPDPKEYTEMKKGPSKPLPDPKEYGEMKKKERESWSETRKESDFNTKNKNIHKFKIVTIGSAGVGKTSEGNKFPEEYVPTIFDNYSIDITVNKEIFRIQLWDTAGQEDYDVLRTLSYEKSDVFIICYSKGSQKSLKDVKNIWIKDLKKNKKTDVPVILVGCKSDLKEQIIEVSTKEGEKMAKKIKAFAHVECSAKNFENVHEVFNEIIQVLYDKTHPEKPKINLFASTTSRAGFKEELDDLDFGLGDEL